MLSAPCFVYSHLCWNCSSALQDVSMLRVSHALSFSVSLNPQQTSPKPLCSDNWHRCLPDSLGLSLYLYYHSFQARMPSAYLWELHKSWNWTYNQLNLPPSSTTNCISGTSGVSWEQAVGENFSPEAAEMSEELRKMYGEMEAKGGRSGNHWKGGKKHKGESRSGGDLRKPSKPGCADGNWQAQETSKSTWGLGVDRKWAWGGRRAWDCGLWWVSVGQLRHDIEVSQEWSVLLWLLLSPPFPPILSSLPPSSSFSSHLSHIRSLLSSLYQYCSPSFVHFLHHTLSLLREMKLSANVVGLKAGTSSKLPRTPTSFEWTQSMLCFWETPSRPQQSEP